MDVRFGDSVKRGFTLYLILIMFLPMVSSFDPENYVLNDQQPILQPGEHAPILITSNSGFNSTNGVSKGNGTPENPYIFEDLLINASTADGMNIKDTTAHFIIRNCSIDGGINRTYDGLDFINVSNFTITNNTIARTRYGFLGTGVKVCSISNSTIYQAESGGVNIGGEGYTVCGSFIFNSSRRGGIKATGSDFLVSDSIITYGLWGIIASGQNKNCTIRNNRIVELTYGLSTTDGNILFLNNTCKDSIRYGFKPEKDSISDVILRGNYFEGGGVGAWMSGFSYLVDGNVFRNQSGTGMRVRGYNDNHTVLNNTFINSGDFAISAISGRFFSNRLLNCSFDLRSWRNDRVTLIPQNNTVNEKPVRFFDGIDPNGPMNLGDPGQVILCECRDVLIEDLFLQGGGNAIQIIDSTNVSTKNLSFSGQKHSGLFLQSSTDIIIKSCDFKNSYYGIFCRGSYWGGPLNNYIHDANFHNCTFGLSLMQVPNAEILNCSITDCELGVELFGKDIEVMRVQITNCTTGFNFTGENYIFEDCSISNCSGNGIEGYDIKFGAPPDFTTFSMVRSNISHNNGDGLHIDNIAGFSMYECNFHNNSGHGSWMKAVDGYTIRNCSFNDNGETGLYMESGKMLYIFFNQFNNNTMNGAEIYMQDPLLRFHDNNCSNNEGSGARLIGPMEVLFNQFENNSQVGLEVMGDVMVRNNSINKNSAGILLSGDNNDLYDNFIIDNYVGINVKNSTDNLIYNNYFSNYITCELDGSESQNEWDLNVPTYSMNIIGGPLIRGNYWSDYNGVDISGDLCGDTNVPHGPGDWFPLIRIPTEILLTDETVKFGLSSIEHYINISVITSSPGNLRMAYINATLIGTNYTDNLTYWIYTFNYPTDLVRKIHIPKWCTKIEYTCDINDKFGNNASVNGSIDVIDDISPEIISIEPSLLVNGETHEVEVEVIEQIGVRSIVLYKEEFPYDEQMVEYKPTSSMNDQITLTYVFDVDIGSSVEKVRFIAIVTDLEDNIDSMTTEWLDVKDRDAPQIKFIGYDPNIRDGDTILDFRIWDNRKVEKATIDVGFPGYTYSVFKDLELVSANRWEVLISLPVLCTGMVLKVTAFDGSFSIGYNTFIVNLTFDADLLVKDITKGKPRTGEEYDITFWINQTYYLQWTGLKYKFDTNEIYKTRESWGIHIDMVPINARNLTYIISLLDGYGKWINLSFKKNVMDTISPSLELLHNIPINSKIFHLSLDIEENREIKETKVLYDLGWGWTYWNPVYDTQYTLTLPEHVTEILVNCTVVDSSNNRVERDLLLSIEDRTPPEIVNDNSYVSYYGSKNVLFLDFDLQENRKIERVTCLWEFDDGSSGDLSLIPISDERYKEQLDISKGITQLTYRIEVVDTSGNIIVSSETLLEIEENDDSSTVGLNWIPWMIIPLILIVLGILSLVFLHYRRRSDPWEE